MTAIAAETARGSRASGDVFLGALLASGAAALFVGTLFYACLTPELGLPALPAERAQALADALRLGPQPLALAGGFAFLGDCLLLAACIALASRRAPSKLDSAGWALNGGQRRARHGVRFNDGGAVLPVGACLQLHAVRCGQIVVRLSLRRRQRPLWARLHRRPLRGYPSRRTASAAGRLVCRDRHRGRGGDQRARRGARRPASAACHRPQRDIRLRDSRLRSG